jgi:hypothetical protein
MIDSSQPIHAMRRSRRESCCRNLSSASRRATTWPAICWEMYTQRPTAIERCAKWPNSWASTALNSPSVTTFTRPSPISRFFLDGTMRFSSERS